MANCSVCGTGISFIRSARSDGMCEICAAKAKVARDEAVEQYQQWLDWTSYGPDDLAKAADAFKTLLPRTKLSPAELAKRRHSAFQTYASRILADDVLTEVEEVKMQDVAELLDISQQDIQESFPGLMNQLVVARVNDDRLPEIDSSSIIAQKGEIVHAEVPANLMKEVTLREFRGGYQGVSIPLGHGFRYRTGAGRGHSVVVGTEMQVADSGVLVATSQRAVFIGGRKTLEFKLSKLISLNVFQDAIEMHVSNRQNASLLAIPPSAVDAISAVIRAAAERLAMSAA